MAQETSKGYFEERAEVSEVLDQSTPRRPWAVTSTESVDGEKHAAHTVCPASTGEDPSWLLGTGSILSDVSVDMRSDCVKHSIDDLEESDMKICNEAERASFNSYQQHIPGGSEAHHSMHGPAVWMQSCDNAISRSDTANSSNTCNDIFSIPSEGHEESDCSMSVVGSRERHECYSEPVQDVPERCASMSQDDGGAPHSKSELRSTKHTNAIVSKVPPSADSKNRTPLRLLYVIYALHGTELHLSEIHQAQPPVYLAFSHSWAQNVQIAATTKASLKKCDRNIQVTSLPGVIQDAVAITKTLGLSYLWIDAFCEYKTGKGRSDHIYELWTIFCEAYAMIISDVSALTFVEGLPGIRSIEIRMPSHRERLGKDLIWRGWLKSPLKPWTSLSKIRTSTSAEIHWATFDADLGETCTKSHLCTRYGGKLFGITAPIAADIASLFLEKGTEVSSNSQGVLDALRANEWYIDSISSLAFSGIASSSLLAQTSRPGTIHATQTPVSVPPDVGDGNSGYYGNCGVPNNGKDSGPKLEPTSLSSLQEAGPQLETTDTSAEPAVDYASTQASEHNGCKLRCPRLVADQRGPNCAQGFCATHNYVTVGRMKEGHLRKSPGHKYSEVEVKIPRVTGASERTKWNLLFLRLVYGWNPENQTYGEWLESHPMFTEFPVPYLCDESNNCVDCHQPCYPEPVTDSASLASPVMQSRSLPQIAQAGLDQTLLDPHLRVPEQSPGHQLRRPHLSPSRSSQDERSLHGCSSNKRRKTCSGSRGSIQATHASGNALEEVDALAPQAAMRQAGEEVAESSTPSAQRSGSSPSFSFVERSTNATSRLTDVEPPSSPLPVEKLCSCPDWKEVGETHFFCHGKDFCNCCSNFKAWSEKGEAILRQLPKEICRCKDWPGENFHDPHVRCHGKQQCFCCGKWKAYSERGQRFLVSHERA